MSGFEFRENVMLAVPDVKHSYAAFKESEHRANNKLIVEIAAIHVGLTSNFNMYSKETLEDSLSSWVNPYPRPIILNHDQMSESIGRIMASKMMEESDGTHYIRLQAAITDPLAIEKVLDERYLTGSVGGAAKSARCSICNVDWVEAMESGQKTAPCRHRRGSVYEGKLSYFDLAGLKFKEYSFVNVPADEQSQVRAITPAADSSEETGEWSHTVKMYSLNMNTPAVVEMSESDGHNLLESMTKREAKSTYMNLKGTFLTVSAHDYKENEEENSNSSKTQDTNNNDAVAKNHMSTSSQSDENILKEKKMADKAAEVNDEQEDDILAVSEQLANDLANVESDEEPETDDAPAEDAAAEEEESTEETSEETAELPENSGEEADTAAEEGDAEEEEEPAAADEQVVESPEEPEGDDAADNDEADDAEATSAEEGKAEGQENGNTTEPPQDPTRESALEDENKKLREALRHMLVERVVDAKIARGMGTDRAAMIAEHSTRTAASLGDSLKDLASVPAKGNVTEDLSVPRVEESTLVAAEENVESEADDATEKAPEVTPYERAENYFYHKLNGGAQFNHRVTH